ncbi:hypothetical protein AgCh_017770 [Apium graveolens]
MHKKKKKMPFSAQHEMKVRNKLISPEFEELKREGYEGARARSSHSDEVARGRSSSRDNYADRDLDHNEYMEMEEERNNGSTTVSHIYIDFEDEHDSHNTPEPVAPQRNVNMLQGCRSIDEFERLNKIMKLNLSPSQQIFKMLGTPNETIWPGFSELPGVKRITADAALSHEWFFEVPLPKSKVSCLLFLLIMLKTDVHKEY